jgi:hypothetical protein
MTKTDLEIKINGRLILSVAGVIAGLILIFYLFQVYDDHNKKVLYHKMYTTLSDSPDMQKINGLAATIDTSKLYLYCGQEYYKGNTGTTPDPFVDNQTRKLIDSISDLFACFRNSNREFYDHLEIYIPIGAYFMSFYTDYSTFFYIRRTTELTGYDKDMMQFCNANGPDLEDKMREKYCEGKELCTMVKLNNPKYRVYVKASIYWK